MRSRELKEAEGRYLTESPLSRDLIDNIHGMSREYLSHEYMSAHWAPAFHADVAGTMAEAKLDWVASANPLENFPELMLTAEQRKMMDRFSDPIMRELIKDSCLPRQLRHDVYVRGARRLGNDQRDAAIAGLAVTPVIGAEELQTTLHVPAGTAEMSDALKGLMAAAMRGPTTIGDLLALDPEHSNASELVSVLVGTHQCEVAMRPDGEQPAAANRLNRLLGSRIKSVVDARASGLACSRLGTGLILDGNAGCRHPPGKTRYCAQSHAHGHRAADTHPAAAAGRSRLESGNYRARPAYVPSRSVLDSPASQGETTVTWSLGALTRALGCTDAR